MIAYKEQDERFAFHQWVHGKPTTQPPMLIPQPPKPCLCRVKNNWENECDLKSIKKVKQEGRMIPYEEFRKMLNLRVADE